MNDRFHQLEKAKLSVRLDAERKEAIRARLVGFMATTVRAAPRPFFFFRLAPVMAGILVLALVGGGTSFASETALPGDLLYPIKVSVVEEVRAALSPGIEAKTQWEAERAERRLTEAAMLLARGETEEVVDQKIGTAFRAHTEAVEEQLVELENAGEKRTAVAIASRLEASLGAYSAVLRELSGESVPRDAEAASVATLAVPPGEPSTVTLETMHVSGTFSKEAPPEPAPLSPVIMAVEAARSRMEETVRGKNGSLATAPAATAQLKAAEETLKKAKERLDRDKDKIGKGETEAAESRLRTGREVVKKVRQQLSEQAYEEAFKLGTRALKIGEETKVLVGASADLNINAVTRSGENYREEDDDEVEASALVGTVSSTASSSSGASSPRLPPDGKEERRGGPGNNWR